MWLHLQLMFLRDCSIVHNCTSGHYEMVRCLACRSAATSLLGVHFCLIKVDRVHVFRQVLLRHGSALSKLWLLAVSARSCRVGSQVLLPTEHLILIYLRCHLHECFLNVHGCLGGRLQERHVELGCELLTLFLRDLSLWLLVALISD